VKERVRSSEDNNSQRVSHDDIINMSVSWIFEALSLCGERVMQAARLDPKDPTKDSPRTRTFDPGPWPTIFKHYNTRR
jgi:hypothetical protein